MVGRKGATFILLCCLCWFSGRGAAPADAAGSAVPVEIDARSYVLMELESGQILAKHGAERAYAPASLTKIMTEYLVLERIEDGKLSWKDPVRVDANAARIGEAEVYLKAGEERTVRELFTAMAVYSANDAAVALAEHIAGSETTFVSLMNRKADELGLSSTHFTNCTGLPKRSYPDYPDVKGTHRMSAEDVALLTRRLLKDHPDVVGTVSLARYTFRPGESGERKLVNSNTMLPGLSQAYEGLDGVKTGYTREAGYGFSGSAARKGMRLVSVVMGTNSKSARFTETKKLLDYGFDRYQREQLVAKGKSVPGKLRVPVENGAETTASAVAEKSLVLPVMRGEKGKYGIRVEITKHLTAPLKAGTVVGTAKILYDGEEISGVRPIRLVAREAVEEAGWWRLLLRSLFGED